MTQAIDDDKARRIIEALEHSAFTLLGWSKVFDLDGAHDTAARYIVRSREADALANELRAGMETP